MNNEMDGDSRVSLRLLVTGVMIPILLAAVVFWMVWFFFTATAIAQAAPPQQVTCMPFNKLRDALMKTLKETEISIGLANPQTTLTIFASPKGETWTAAIVGINGMACIISSGTDWSQQMILTGDPV